MGVKVKMVLEGTYGPWKIIQAVNTGYEREVKKEKGYQQEWRNI